MVTLVCGMPEEAPISMLLQSLEKRGGNFLLLDQERLADRVQLRWQLTDSGISGQLKIGNEVLDIHDIQSIYHRFVPPEDLTGTDSSSQVLKKTRSILRSLMELFEILPVRIVNRRRPMMSNNSKPYQALLIQQAGFAIPATLVTNVPEALVQFSSVNGSLIYKSISSVRSIVASLDEKCVTRLDSLHYLPTQFQQKIEGYNVRVHVIGRRIFATQILTSATDYRYASQEGIVAKFRPYELNVELRKRCLHLARICQLPFAGIDLIVNTSKVYCLEVNPSPGYSYYQEATGQPISDALAKYLLHK